MTVDRDTERRYLVTVSPEHIPGDPDDTHLAVLSWAPRAEAWIHGQAICGRSVPQGELPAATAITCTDCLSRQDDYERILANNPADLQAAYVQVLKQLPRTAAADLLTTMTRDPNITPTNPIMLAAALVVTGHGLGWITEPPKEV